MVRNFVVGRLYRANNVVVLCTGVLDEYFIRGTVVYSENKHFTIGQSPMGFFPEDFEDFRGKVTLSQ